MEGSEQPEQYCSSLGSWDQDRNREHLSEDYSSKPGVKNKGIYQ